MEELLRWKDKDSRKSLIISGARQIGKTYIVREFGKRYYDTYIELNFLEQPDLKNIFAGNLDVNSLIFNLSLYRDIRSMQEGKTLILLDEIQECPQAMASLKFWTLDKRYDVIATGSALGINFSTISSYPVGHVEYMDMYALSFTEFLWANQIDDSFIETLRSFMMEKKAVPLAIHQKMAEVLQYYMIVGGMPDVVNEYITSRNIVLVDEIQKRIYRDYIADIARMAPPQIKIKAEKCYRSIPLQISGENHKFQYSVIEKKGTSAKFETSLDWLKNAFIVKDIHNLKTIDYPPELYADETNFRLYPTDIGLLMATLDLGMKKALLSEKSLEESPSHIMLGTVKGGLYEALAADLLIKNGHKQLYFYKHPKNTMEIEFLYLTEDGLIPVEIKAGRKKANSLASILENDKIPYGYKLASQNIGVSGKRITLPLYMLCFL